MKPIPPRAACALAIVLCAISLGETRGNGSETATRHRHPVALSLSPDGSRLFAANRRSGSLSVIDRASGRVVAEHDIGQGLSDVAALPDGRHLLAVDQAAGALLLLEVADGSARVVARQEVSTDPVTVEVAQDGRSCVVASTWSRRLTSLAISGPSIRVVRTLDLPFSPRNMVLARGGTKLIVADAFGGKLAVVDAGRGALESVRSLPAHSIRGLAATPDGKTLVLAHQVLRRIARADFEDVHWGRLLTSHVRSLRMDAVLAGGTDADILRGGEMISLGSPTEGAGDPSALACDRSGRLAIALAGVHEVAFMRSPTAYVHRFAAGRRPTAVAFALDGRAVYVADTFDDTVSVLDAGTGRRTGVISLGPRPEPSLAERGEQLFHDARLSHDGWMSCQSCHTDGHSNGQLGDTLGDDSYGAPKRVPSLLGTGTTGPWAWNGAVKRLEDQVRKSIETTMRGRDPSDEQVAAIAAYLRTLTPPRTTSQDERSVARGRAVFAAQDCAQCHAPPHYTGAGRYDVGLSDEAGNREFNPPSLRGVGGRTPLLHDGRAETLEEVFLGHRHPLDAEMTPADVADLVAFLKTL